MYSKIKKVYGWIQESYKNSIITKKHSSELIWANVFHDSINDRPWLKNLPLSPGRMACNYSFLYILTKTLINIKPKRILEFGLGESSKLISTIITYELTESIHHIVEHDHEWISFFSNNYSLSNNSKIIQSDLIVNNINQLPHYSYDNISDKLNSDYDLYVIDGPFGSKENSRREIIDFAKRLQKDNNFIIIVDDYNRQGEKDTVEELLSTLKKRDFKIFTGIYSGNKDQIIITTEKHRFMTKL